MFAELLDTFTQLINQHPTWAGLIVFLVAMVESLAIIGVVIPGVAIMFGVGTLISNGTLDMASTVMWAAAGASFGDGLSFALGKHYDKKIYTIAWFKNNPDVLKNGREFFEKYGAISILIGRFIGPIRAIIPLIAGILDMPTKHYIPTNLIASALWAPAYLIPGFFFGKSTTLITTNLENGWPFILLFAVLIWAFYKILKQR
jgi:undecaprenyl-diphosphatase|tara:strand:+ start:4044 stop:4649 length:606 start_codon:yes stop_codon:yes gene_type:complete